MISRKTPVLSAVLSILAVSQTHSQTVDLVIVGKSSQWVQSSASDPIINPRLPGPHYGGPYGFRVNVYGTNIAAIDPPTVTLPLGSLYPAQAPFNHNGGVLVYNATDKIWRYGVDANDYGGTTEAGRDASFAFGIYTMNVQGESFSLNFPATAFPVNTPKVTLTGGTWSGGKYIIDVTQPLTITTNIFTNYDQNADGVMELWVESITDQIVFRSENPGGGKFITYTIPANTLVAGADYHAEASFYAIMDKRGAFGARLDATAYERRTAFVIAAIAAPNPAAVAKFHGVGELDGGSSFSNVRDATKVGGILYAVGDTNGYGIGTGGDTGFLWTSTDGLRPLADLVTNFTGVNFSNTLTPAITPDGKYIAGLARTLTGGAARHAVRVTSNGLTNLDLGSLPGFGNSQANAISSDGSVLYGTANYTTLASVPVKTRAVRFTASGPTIATIPFLNVGDDTSAPVDRGTSADGSVMAGRSTNGTVDASDASPGGAGIGLGNQAFRYVHGVGISGIPFLGGGTWSGAVALSPDGNLTLVRGDSTSAPQGEFYLHNAATGTLTSYGTPNGSRRPGGIVGMTSDGSVVATPFGPVDNPTASTYIRNQHGWHDFQSIVEGAGVDLSGWSLRENIFGMSLDGTLVWGRGLHNGNAEGFVVEFPPGYLAAVKEPEVYSTPDAAIVGAWTTGDTSTADSAVLIFFSNGYYIHIEQKDDLTSAHGFERGQYTWDHITGAFTCNTLLDTTGDSGLGSISQVTGITFTVVDDTLTATIPGDEGFTLSRVISSNPIVGAWGDATHANDSAAVVFLPNGYYFMAQDGDSSPAGDPTGHDGMEWGTYIWNAATGALTTSALVDTNGEWGLSHPGDPQTAIVSDNLLSLTLTDGSGPTTVFRVGSAAQVATVQAGTNQTVTIGSTDENVSLTFESVSEGSVTVETSTFGPPPPDGFLASTGSGPSVYYDISTTATFSGLIEIVVHYDPASFVDIAGLRLFHYENGAWTDITTWHNVAHSKLYGLTASLSPFAIFEPSLMVSLTAPAVGTLVPVNTDVTLAATAEGHVPGRTYDVVWRLKRSGASDLTFHHVASTPNLERVIQVPDAGVYAITLSVTSNDGLKANATLVQPDLLPTSLIVYDSDDGFVTGGGTIFSPKGAYAAFPGTEGPATFAFVSKYQKGAKKPSGNSNFDFQAGGLRFKSTDYEWLVIAGSRAQYKGTGTINGLGDYAFIITAEDSASGDRFRIKITDRATDALLYDNQKGAADSDALRSSTIITSGSIVIHKP